MSGKKKKHLAPEKAPLTPHGRIVAMNNRLGHFSDIPEDFDGALLDLLEILVHRIQGLEGAVRATRDDP